MRLSPDIYKTVHSTLAAIILFAFLLTIPAHAQSDRDARNGEEQNSEGYVYSPAGCEFEITFPEEPHTIRRCHEKLPDKCTLMSGYTKVFGVDATVNMYVSCKPSEENLKEEFSPDVMRTSLLARPGVESLEVYDISHDTSEYANTAALIGAGKTENGNNVMIYVAQIWAGESSIFTLEGELIGHSVEEADFLFADIMKSLHHKDEPLPADREDPDESQGGDSAEAETENGADIEAETIGEEDIDTLQNEAEEDIHEEKMENNETENSSSTP